MSRRSSVDLPLPLGPTTATNSPGRTASDTSSSTSGPSSAYRKESPRAASSPVSSPGALAEARTSGSASSTGRTCSYSGSTATAETRAPVSCVTEVSIMVTAVLKVRNSAADRVPRAGPASSMNISSEQSGR